MNRMVARKVTNMLDAGGKSGEGEWEDKREGRGGSVEEMVDEKKDDNCSMLWMRGEGEGSVTIDASGTIVHHH